MDVNMDVHDSLKTPNKKKWKTPLKPSNWDVMVISLSRCFPQIESDLQSLQHSLYCSGVYCFGHRSWDWGKRCGLCLQEGKSTKEETIWTDEAFDSFEHQKTFPKALSIKQFCTKNSHQSVQNVQVWPGEPGVAMMDPLGILTWSFRPVWTFRTFGAFRILQS